MEKRGLHSESKSDFGKEPDKSGMRRLSDRGNREKGKENEAPEEVAAGVLQSTEKEYEEKPEEKVMVLDKENLGRPAWAVPAVILILTVAAAALVVGIVNHKKTEPATAGNSPGTTTVTPVPSAAAPLPSVTAAASPTVTPVSPTAARVPDYEVDLDDEGLSDFSSIDNINGLTSLSMAFNKITACEELEACVNLTYLNLQNNQIKDIGALKSLTKLYCLNLSDNEIEDLNALSRLDSLQILILSNNSITNLKPLRELDGLTELRLDGNPELSDISVIADKSELRMLVLSNTKITDLSPLMQLTKLEMLDVSGLTINEAQRGALKKALPDCDIIY
jgi:internalin A